MVRLWLRRFDAGGLEGLQDRPRSGRPATYTPVQIGEVVAASLDAIEPRWQGLRSLALEGRRLPTREDVRRSLRDATADWDAHRPHFVWGRRCHRPRRQAGIGLLPTVAQTRRTDT